MLLSLQPCRNIKLLPISWTCTSLTFSKVNFDKLSTLAGFTNPRSASNAWGIIKKKLAAQAGEVDGDADGTPKPTPAKKRGKKSAEVEGEDGQSPSKKMKKTPKKTEAAKVKEEVVEDAEVDGEAEKGAGEDDGIF